MSPGFLDQFFESISKNLLGKVLRNIEFEIERATAKAKRALNLPIKKISRISCCRSFFSKYADYLLILRGLLIRKLILKH